MRDNEDIMPFCSSKTCFHRYHLSKCRTICSASKNDVQLRSGQFQQGGAFCSYATFGASIGASIFQFASVDVWAYKLKGFSREKLDAGIRVLDPCPDVMVDGCKARGAHSEITSFAPAGRSTFHDSIASHIMHNVLQVPSHTKRTHTVESCCLAGVAYLIPLQMQALARAISTVSNFFSS